MENGWKHENNSPTGRNQSTRIFGWLDTGGSAGSDFPSGHLAVKINRTSTTL
jgi:hypothetical protein